MSARRSRVRRVAKWVGTLCSALVAAAWGASYGGYRWWSSESAHLMVKPGAVGLIWEFENFGSGPAVGRTLSGSTMPTAANSYSTCGTDALPLDGQFTWERLRQFAHLSLLLRFQHEDFRWPRLARHSPWLLAATPFWFPFLAVGVPSIWLWRRESRRVLPGHCGQCGYNLTGNVSGVCPECGQGIA